MSRKGEIPRIALMEVFCFSTYSLESKEDSFSSDIQKSDKKASPTRLLGICSLTKMTVSMNQGPSGEWTKLVGRKEEKGESINGAKALSVVHVRYAWNK